MNKRDDVLALAGLERGVLESLPLDAEIAVKCIASVSVSPEMTVPLGLDEAVDVLGAKWGELADEVNGEEYYLLPSGAGTIRRGWLRVQDPVSGDLPGRVLRATGSIEFITCSLDGKWLHAVTKEHADYWVIAMLAPQAPRRSCELH